MTTAFDRAQPQVRLQGDHPDDVGGVRRVAPQGCILPGQARACHSDGWRCAREGSHQRTFNTMNSARHKFSVLHYVCRHNTMMQAEDTAHLLKYAAIKEVCHCRRPPTLYPRTGKNLEATKKHILKRPSSAPCLFTAVVYYVFRFWYPNVINNSTLNQNIQALCTICKSIENVYTWC